MLRKMSKALIVGAGMTGAASAALLKQNVPELASVTVWDKGRGAGGRMSTTRCPEDSSITADLGAQYITLTKDYFPKRQSLYDELLEHNILSPLKGKIEGPNSFDQPGADHFVTPQGVSSLVKYFLKKSGAETKYQHTVSGLSLETEKENVKVATKEDISENFDVIVLTLPVPQLLQLQGSIPQILGNQADIKQKLEAVSYSSRYAYAAFYPPGAVNVPWSARYLADDPVIRFITVDQIKRGVDQSTSGQALVVHTHVPYALNHLEDNMEDVKREVSTRLADILPDLPQPLSAKIQRWRYSQIHKTYKDTPGCIVLNQNPLIIVAGDAFTRSTFDGCFDSAEAVLKTVQDNVRLNKQKSGL